MQRRSSSTASWGPSTPPATRSRASTAATGSRAAPAATMAVPGDTSVAIRPMAGPPSASPTASAWPTVDSTVARTFGSISGTNHA
jgi:hypothetical protein